MIILLESTSLSTDLGQFLMWNPFIYLLPEAISLFDGTCAKQSIARWCDKSMTMARLRTNDDTVEHHRYRCIASTLSHYRAIPIAPARYLYRYHCLIDLAVSHNGNDSELHDPIWIPYCWECTGILMKSR